MSVLVFNTKSTPVTVNLIKFKELAELKKLGRISKVETLKLLSLIFIEKNFKSKVLSIATSLRCPISRVKLNQPVRGLVCRHIECFDLKSIVPGVDFNI